MFTFVAEEKRKDTQAVGESFNVWSLKTILPSFHLRKVEVLSNYNIVIVQDSLRRVQEQALERKKRLEEEVQKSR